MAQDLAGERRRHIPLEGGSNLRDVGGYETGDGRKVRWGRIYRSGAMPKLTEADWRWMSEQGVRTVCDLRADQERTLAPTNWRGPDHTRHIGAPYPAELIFVPPASEPAPTAPPTRALNEMHQNHYPVFPKLLAAPYREMFAALVADETPLIVHCSAGQDRTGLAIGLVLTALGVPRPLIFEDYLLSTQHRRLENELDRTGLADLAHQNVVARYYTEALARYGEAVLTPRRLIDNDGRPLLLTAMTSIEQAWGSLEAYMDQELGVGEGETARLRALYLA